MHSRAHAFLAHPLAASSLASTVVNPDWQLVANNTQPAIDVELVIPNQLCTDLDFLRFFSFSPRKIFGGLAPIWVRRCKLHFSRYRLVKVS